MADGIPTDPPTSREIDFGALVRRALGDEYHKHEKVYQVGKGRTFESSDYGTQGIYGAARSVVLSGTAAGGDSSSVTLGTKANGGGNDYVAHQISAADFALTTQTSTIVAYNESTRSARVIPSWASNFVLHTGTAQGAGGNYLTLGTGAPSTVTGTLSLTSGAGSTQSRDIISYDDSAKRAVVSKWDAPYLSIGSDDDGTQATLYLDFPDLGSGQVDTTPTFGTVSPTFTRSGATATTVGSDGLVIKSIGANVPRSYYDPTSLEYLGYLAEGARTNLRTRSEEFDDGTAWPTKTDITLAADNTSSPDGAVTADRATEGTAGNAVVQSNATTVSDGATITASIFVKRSSVIQWFRFRVQNNGGTNAGVFWADIQNGVAGSAANVGSATATSGSLKAYQNGWYRVTVTTTLAAGDVTAVITMSSASADASTTRVNSSVYWLWGAQLEAAAFASSYIPTTTAAVTRNADVLTYPTTGWLNAAAGTLMHEATNMVAGVDHKPYQIDDGTANERIQSPINSSNNHLMVVVDGGVTQVSLTVAAATLATYKKADAWAVNDFASCVDGGTVATDTSGTIPTVTTLRISDVLNSVPFFGPIRRVAYFPLRFLNATLVTLTGSGLTFDPSTFPVALPGATTVYKVEKVGPGVNTTYSISAT